MVRISEPFKSYCTYQVACFLRFIYHPEEACTANFKAMGSQLTSVVHLAHHLNAAALLTKLDTYLSEAVDAATAEHAVAWLHLSEECSLHKLRVKCIRQVVHALGSMGRDSRWYCDSPRQHKRGAVAAVADVDPLLKVRCWNRRTKLPLISSSLSAGPEP